MALGGAATLGDLVFGLKAKDVSLKKGVATGKRDVGSLKKAGVASARAIGAAFTVAGAAISAMFATGLKDVLSFRDGLKKVETLGVENIKALEEGLKDFAVATGQDAIKMTEDLYNTLSAGIPEDAAIMVLEAAYKGAAAGAGELSSALDAGTSIMNAYGLQGDNAVETTRNFEEIMGQFAVAIKTGKTTIDDLGGAVGKAAGLFSKAGISTEEYLAITAALTTTGVKATEAITGLKAAVANILIPSEKATKAAEEMGITFEKAGFSFSAASLKQKGAVEFFGDVVKKVEEFSKRHGKNSTEELAKLFGSVEALNSVLQFTGPLAGKVDEALLGMADSQKTLNEMSQAYLESNPKILLDQALQGFKVLKMELSEALLPVLLELLGHVTKFMKLARDWIKANPELAAKLSLVTAALGAIMVVLGPILLVLPGIIMFFTTIGPLFTFMSAIALPALGTAFTAAFLPVVGFIAAAGGGWALGRWFDKMIDKWLPGLGKAIDLYMGSLVWAINKIKEFLGLAEKAAEPGKNFEAERAALLRDIAAGDIIIPDRATRGVDAAGFAGASAGGGSSSTGGAAFAGAPTVNINMGGVTISNGMDLGIVNASIGASVESALRRRGVSLRSA